MSVLETFSLTGRDRARHRREPRTRTRIGDRVGRSRRRRRVRELSSRRRESHGGLHPLDRPQRVDVPRRPRRPCRARRDGGGGRTRRAAAGHSRQQRGRHRAPPGGEVSARRLGPRVAHQPRRGVAPQPTLRRANDRAWFGKDHQHRIRALVQRRAHRGRVRGEQACDRRSHQGARQRVGVAQRASQRDRAGLLRHRQHAAASRECGTRGTDQRAHPRRTLG